MGMSHAYGKPLDARQARQVLPAALDLGCTYFDTAEIYGTLGDPHLNERLIAEAIGSRRSEFAISSDPL